MPAKIDKEKCTGCESCVEECPSEAIKMVVEKAANAGEADPFNSDTVVKYLEQTATLENPVELTRKIAFYPPGQENIWDHDLVWGDEYVRNWISQWIDGKWYQIWPEDKANAELKLPPWFK